MPKIIDRSVLLSYSIYVIYEFASVKVFAVAGYDPDTPQVAGDYGVIAGFIIFG